MEKLSAQLAGQRFGRWLVVSYTTRGLWLCVCDCGTSRRVSTYSLRKNKTRSCGCGYGQQHGGSNTSEYHIWNKIKERCLSEKCPAYDNYGGRGIGICDEWRYDFAKFVKDMGPRPTPKHSVDRINNDGNYEPSNCRWATRYEQSRNTRKNRLITIGETTKPLSDWADDAGVNRGTFLSRVNRGVPPEVALSFKRFEGRTAGRRSVVLHAFGQSKTLAEWCRSTGLAKETIRRRLKQGWSAELACSKDVDGRRLRWSSR